MTISDLAEQAGVARPTIHRHFSDHREETRSVRPPQVVFDALAFVGRRLSYGPQR